MKSETLWHKSWGDPSNRTIIFLHGFMGSHLDFLPTIENLSDDFHCISLDLPGHGHSKEILPKTPEELEELILASLAPHLKSNCSLVGYSMGGRVSISLTKKIDPEFLILISARIDPLSAAEAKAIHQRDEKIATSFQEDNYTLFLEKWYSMPIFKTLKNKSSLYQKMVQERKSQDPIALAHILRLLSPSTYTLDPLFLEKLSCPLLYLSGREDSKYDKMSKKIHNKKKEAWLYSLSNTSHALHIEDPLNTSQIIKKFHRYYYD